MVSHKLFHRVCLLHQSFNLSDNGCVSFTFSFIAKWKQFLKNFNSCRHFHYSMLSMSHSSREAFSCNIPYFASNLVPCDSTLRKMGVQNILRFHGFGPWQRKLFSAKDEGDGSSFRGRVLNCHLVWCLIVWFFNVMSLNPSLSKQKTLLWGCKMKVFSSPVILSILEIYLLMRQCNGQIGVRCLAQGYFNI